MVSRMMVRGLMAVAFAIAATACGAQSTIVADPMEADSGWTLIDGSWGVNGQMGFNASAGIWYWGSSWQQPATVGLHKTFSGVTVGAGVYTITIKTMCPPGDPYRPVPLGDFSVFGLTGISAADETVLSALTPVTGVRSWTPWTLEYTVPSDSPDIGNSLGFDALYRHNDYTYYSVMLDDLHVTYQPVPEPGTLALMGSALLGIGIVYLRRHKE
jgi:hypothetical protein